MDNLFKKIKAFKHIRLCVYGYLFFTMSYFLDSAFFIRFAYIQNIITKNILLLNKSQTAFTLIHYFKIGVFISNWHV